MSESRKAFSRTQSGVCISLLLAIAACGGGKDSADSVQTTADGAKLDTLKVGGQAYSAQVCAVEGGQCNFTGEQLVAYGSNDQYIVKKLMGGAACTNATFGDAAFGMVKTCYLLIGITFATPVPTQPDPRPSLPPVATTPAPPAASSPAVDPTSRPSKPEASRFLVQATFGPTLAEIDRLSSSSYGAWLDQQFATAPMDSYWSYVRRAGPIGCSPCTSGNVNAVMEAFWMQAVRGPDQLRQRTVLALSELFVISAVNTSIETVPTAHAAYLDMLGKNAFGNFRTLLEQVATHPSMGIYLSHMQNDKEDPATGRLPDENFARELMQLFTVGLWELNDDGSRKKDAGGNDVPTYSQAEIMGMAKVFTGLSWGNGDWASGFLRGQPQRPLRAGVQPADGVLPRPPQHGREAHPQGCRHPGEYARSAEPEGRPRHAVQSPQCRPFRRQPVDQAVRDQQPEPRLRPACEPGFQRQRRRRARRHEGSDPLGAHGSGSTRRGQARRSEGGASFASRWFATRTSCAPST